MDERLARFIGDHPDAAMITLRPDGSAHAARIEVALVEGRLWSSGAQALTRTGNLRRDPRGTLFVFAPPPDPRWAGLATTVRLLDDPDAPDLHVRLMRARHGDAAPAGMLLAHDDAVGGDRPWLPDEYRTHVQAERRLIYDFTVTRAYGNY
ncbi:Pyridoxamine 5'-phosphate oxidase [Frankia torreyi]|uniref:Pyridoxamine 5'-phosphate oxidase n=1 Tax=Frankia torreyi TaxID=1856 RepID=A0A0D8BHM0_9ACTN|nr:MULTISPECIES: pyridoxamine 5'-phosphate oxidase family protein [Frankia]KJE23489.1 Pyridoxamine 5'-phosphate oxidase [Frankia torreyi]KQM05509.1 Pyridoxamine 5'-phosphate oxidase [Frankia sp. CpI1-P]